MHALDHFKTISKHKALVTGYCFRMGLIRQGLLHDLSKYAPVEFLEGARYWQGNRSPNNAEREDTGVSMAWLHHKGRNKHHFEYWIDYGINCDTIIRGTQIPRRYVAEMVADRISASRVYLGDAYTDKAPLEYFMYGRDKLWYVHDQVKDHLTFLLQMLAEKGEDETIRYIREVYLKNKGELKGPVTPDPEIAEAVRKMREAGQGDKVNVRY